MKRSALVLSALFASSNVFAATSPTTSMTAMMMSLSAAGSLSSAPSPATSIDPELEEARQEAAIPVPTFNFPPIDLSDAPDVPETNWIPDSSMSMYAAMASAGGPVIIVSETKMEIRKKIKKLEAEKRKENATKMKLEMQANPRKMALRTLRNGRKAKVEAKKKALKKNQPLLATDLELQIEQIDSQIKEIEADLKPLDEEIAAAQAYMDVLQAEIDALQKKLEK